MPLEIVYRPLKSLVPNPRNARTHSAAQIATLAALLKEYGWTNSILTAGDDILAGHGRQIAALGLAERGTPIPRNPDPWSAPTVDLSHLTPAQRKAYILADNRSALEAGWDPDLLRLELGSLSDLGFDLSLTGFSLGELDQVFATPRTIGAGGDPDAIPDVPTVPVTRRGDVWMLGPADGGHRLMCGNAGDQDDVDTLMLGVEADFCLTSPPYSGQRKYGGKDIEDWDALMNGVFGCLPMSEAAQVLVNLGLVHKDHEWQPYWDGWIQWMRVHGWRRFGMYVWDQGQGLPGDWRGRLPPSFELIFHFNRAPARVRKTKVSKHAGEMSSGMLRSGEATFTGLRAKGATAIGATKKMDSVIRITRHKGALGKGIDHPAVFPIGLPLELIPVFTDLRQVVFDPFSGAGTTLLACHGLDRSFFGMEIEPRYVDVALVRWQRVTGQTAVRESDGARFADQVAFQQPMAAE